MTTALTAQVRLPADEQDARAIVAEVKKKYRESCEWRWMLTGEWMLDQAFFRGQQWVVCDWRSGDAKLRETKNLNFERRHTENLVTPYTMSVIQLLNSARPKMEFVPKPTVEVEDTQAALISQMALDYIDDVISWRTVVKEMNQWRAVLGTGFIRFWIDPEAGETLRLPQLNTQTGKTEVVEIQEGEVRAREFSPWNVHVFPTNAATPRDVVRTQFVTDMPVEDARKKWPKFAEKIQPIYQVSAYDANKQRVEALNSPLSASAGYAARQGMVQVIEDVSVPVDAATPGRRLVVVNDLLVENEENEIAKLFEVEAPNYLKMGWVCFRFIPAPGCMWSRGAVNDMRSPQIRLNDLVTDMTRHRKAHLRAKVFIPDDAGINKITNSTTEVNYYRARPGVPAITVVQPISLGSAPFAERQSIREGMGETSMRPEVARGLSMRNVRSAEQASLMLDQANQPFGVISEDTELGYAECARLKLALAARYYSDMKITRIVGQTKAYAAGVIRKENLYTDVSVVPGSGMPKNAALWNQMMAQMLPLITASGGAEAQRLASAIVSQIDLGGTKVEMPEQADIDRQDSEIAEMAARGMLIEPETYDNHIVHAERIDSWLKRHPAAPMLTKKILEMHQVRHFMMQARSVMPPMGAMMGNVRPPDSKTTGDRLQGAAGNDQKQVEQRRREEAQVTA